MSRIGTIHEDITTDVVGAMGSWQWLVTLLSAISLVFPAMDQYTNAHLLQPRLIECIEPHVSYNDSTLCTLGRNSTRDRCTKWQINFLGILWIKKSWVLFCDPKIRIIATSVISRLGSIFGCVIFGLVSDSFGRKLSMQISCTAEIGFRTVLVFCDWESWFLLLVFMRTLFASANTFMALILVCEVSSNEWRSRLSALVVAPHALAVACAAPVARLVPVETFDFIAALCAGLVLVLLRWIPESPQWLLFNGNISSAEKILSHAAKMNGKYLDSMFQIKPVDQNAYLILDESRTCLKLCTKSNVRSLIFVTTLFWCLYHFVWNSLYIRVFYNKTEHAIILKILCIVLGMLFINISLMKKLNLRRLLVINLILILFLEMFLVVVRHSMNHETTMDITLWSALSCGVVAQAVILTISPRLLATCVRATLLGACHCAGHLGAILSTIVILLNAIDNVFLMITNVVLTVALLCLCYVLPDVDGRELPDVAEDMDYFSELSKPLRWAAHKNSSSSHEELQIRVHSFQSTDQTLSPERLPARVGVVSRAYSNLTSWLRK